VALSCSLRSSALAHRRLPSFPTRRSSDLFDLPFDARAISDFQSHPHRQTFVFESLLDLAKLPEIPVQPTFFPGRNPAAVHRNKIDRKSTRLNSSHVKISYADFRLEHKQVE